ncbi:MAG: glycosyl hydrolase family 8 [Ignavibacteria bacterium]
MKTTILIILSLICLSTVNSQNYPFPQNVIYKYGIYPSNKNHIDLDTTFINWKARHVTSQGAGGYRRVLWDTLRMTVSEGIGYGMLISVNMNDKPLFDDLLGYYNIHLGPNGLMNWIIDSLGNNYFGLQGSATDAEEDVAYALILADRQWGSGGSINYMQAAINVINKIYEFGIDTVYNLPKSGDESGGLYRVNTSYFAPAYYRAFAYYTGNSGWDSVINGCYNYLVFINNDTTGLVPDWCLPDGNPMPPCPPPYTCKYSYHYDATRTPWRIGMDYLWYGDMRANNFCSLITSFARSVGSANILDDYALNGTPLGMYHNNAFVGPFGVGTMATDATFQNFCDSIYRENATTYSTRWNYFNSSLKTLTLLVQTGNFIPLDYPLPVELTSFTANVNQRNVIMNWSTASEINNSGFEVQRLDADGSWNEVAFVKGHGTTSTPVNYSYEDKNLTTGTYSYCLKQVDYNGNYEYFNLNSKVEIGTPQKYSISQNYPNPFNPVTKIYFDIPKLSSVKISVYDVSGREVKVLVNEKYQPGNYETVFDGSMYSNGVYFYKIQTGDFTETKKMILMK